MKVQWHHSYPPAQYFHSVTITLLIYFFSGVRGVGSGIKGITLALNKLTRDSLFLPDLLFFPYTEILGPLKLGGKAVFR